MLKSPMSVPCKFNKLSWPTNCQFI